MKMITAFVKPFIVADVAHALHHVPGLTGATFSDVRGFGRGRGRTPTDPESLYGTAPGVRVEVVVADEMEETVVRAIANAAHTGNRGDGKIYVSDVSRAVRIATGHESTEV